MFSKRTIIERMPNKVNAREASFDMETRHDIDRQQEELDGIIEGGYPKARGFLKNLHALFVHACFSRVW